MSRELSLPRVRIEWIPVQMYGLGRLGFDYLQLVFEPGDAGAVNQDDWFVMEGVREATRDGTFLSIEGADGRNTLANANLASRAELTNKIGTPEHRGSRALPFEGDEFGAWETMSSYARDIEAEDYPYIASRAMPARACGRTLRTRCAHPNARANSCAGATRTRSLRALLPRSR